MARDSSTTTSVVLASIQRLPYPERRRVGNLLLRERVIAVTQLLLGRRVQHVTRRRRELPERVLHNRVRRPGDDIRGVVERLRLVAVQYGRRNHPRLVREYVVRD